WRCIWLFSRSEGAGSATRRNTRGLTRSVMALMVPPFPAGSRPSKMTMTRRPLAFTHSWRTQSLPCRRVSSLRYCLFFSFLSLAIVDPRLRLPAPSKSPVQLSTCPKFRPTSLREQQLFREQPLVGREDLEVAGETGIVAGTREVRRILQRNHTDLLMSAHFRQLLNRDQGIGDLAVAVECSLLVFGDRSIEPRLHRLEIAADTSSPKDRLQQSSAQGPHGSVATEKLRQIAAHSPKETGQADRRIEQGLGDADVGVGGNQQLLCLDDIRPPFEKRSRKARGNGRRQRHVQGHGLARDGRRRPAEQQRDGVLGDR